MSSNLKYNFIIADTDSCTITKPDMSPFSLEEQESLLVELNSLYPELINWEQEGPYSTMIILKAKNYVMVENGKVKTKGSALKSSTKEIALKEFQNDILKTIIDETFNYEEIYTRYVKEALNVTDIKRWCSKKTITKKVLTPEAKTQQKILDSIQGTDYVEGDKIYTYFSKEGTLQLAENFTGDYDEMVLVKKLHTTAKVFANILPTNELFPNLALKKAAPLLEKYKCII